jgi:ankyrin repeat protein
MAINIFTHIRRGLYDNVYNCIEKEKIDVNQRDDDTGNPPLVVAVEENQIEIVRLLLNHGADANCKDWTSKNTALDVANKKVSNLLRKYYNKEVQNTVVVVVFT